jgi:hypothetical protein
MQCLPFPGLVRIGLLAAFSMLGACSDGPGTTTEPSADPNEPAGSFRIALDPSSLSLNQGENGSVTITATREGGFAGAINLSLQDVPAGIRADLSGATIPAGATQSTLTLAADAAPGDYSLAVLAQASGVESRTAGLGLTVTATSVVAWEALGEGVGDAVRAIVVDPDGNVYAAGDFARAGGATVNNIAMWDGSGWNALGTGVGGMSTFTTVNALALDPAGNLYAGGRFLTAGGVQAHHVAMWDGSSWSAVGDIGFGVGILNAEVNALVVDSEGNLYVGGSFVAVPESNPHLRIHNVATWDGATWTGLGPTWHRDLPLFVDQGIDGGRVDALVIDDAARVYVAGSFARAGGEATSPGIVMWDGETWNPLGSGVENPVHIESLALGGGNLYAGGIFTFAGDVVADNVAMWNGSEWNALGGGIPAGSFLHRVHSLATDSAGRLYAGGHFLASAGAPGNYLAAWDGSAWTPFAGELEGHITTILAIAVDEQDNLYVGGRIWGGEYNHIAKRVR